MNFDDDDDWDVDLIEDLVRKEEEVIAAKRAATQQQQSSIPPLYTHALFRPSVRALDRAGAPPSKKQRPSPSSASDYLDFVSNWKRQSSTNAVPASLSVMPQGRQVQSFKPVHIDGDFSLRLDVPNKPQPLVHHHEAVTSSTSCAHAVQPKVIGKSPDCAGYASGGSLESVDEKDRLIQDLQARVLKADRELSELRRKTLYSNGVLSSLDQKEIEKLRSQILFKDQEIYEAKRSYLEKSKQLKMVSDEMEHLHKKIEDYKRLLVSSVEASGKKETQQEQEILTHSWPYQTFGKLKGTAIKGQALQDQDSAVDSLDDPAVVMELKARTLENGCTSIVQGGKDLAQEACMTETHQISDHNLASSYSRELFELWSSGTTKRASSRLILKFLTLCQADLHVLLSIEAPDDRKLDSNDAGLVVNCRDGDACGSQGGIHSILKKMANGLVSSWTFFMAVLGMCKMENVHVVESALRVLHCLLVNDSGCQNMLFRHSSPKCILSADCQDGLKCIDDSIASHIQLLKLHFPSPRLHFSLRSSSESSPEASTVHPAVETQGVCENSGDDALNGEFFAMIHSLATTSSFEGIKIEAVSILNVLINYSEPIFERKRFGIMLHDGSMSCLLKDTNGLDLRLQAVRLVHNMLHCPHVLQMLFAGDEADGATAEIELDVANLPSRSIEVFEDLVRCLPSRSGTIEEYTLRRNALRVLTFIATSGIDGFATLLSKRVSLGKAREREEEGEVIKDQVPASVVSLPGHLLYLMDHELNLEEEEDAGLRATREERECLIREALILLCRLASRPPESRTTLSALTSENAISMLTVGVANRLINRGVLCEVSQSDGKRDVASTDMIELAKSLKRKVLESLSS